MSRKAAKKPYRMKRANIPELGGKNMPIGTRRGTVRFYGNGPMVMPATAKWFYDGSKEAGKPIGEFMDEIYRILRTEFVSPTIKRHDSDDPVPLTP